MDLGIVLVFVEDVKFPGNSLSSGNFNCVLDYCKVMEL